MDTTSTWTYRPHSRRPGWFVVEAAESEEQSPIVGVRGEDTARLISAVPDLRDACLQGHDEILGSGQQVLRLAAEACEKSDIPLYQQLAERLRTKARMEKRAIEKALDG
jgi:hypothetical protein